MADPTNQRSGVDEVAAFIETVMQTPGNQLTACAGWTVHDIVAHLAAGSAEIADLIERRLAGHAPRPTRPFEEREAPYRAMNHGELLERMLAEGKRAANARHELSALDPPTIDFTGRVMRPEEFATHARSERAVHRWDIVGRDDIGWEMLGQRDLTVHAAKILNEMPALAETPTNRLQRGLGHTPPFEVVLRADDHDDVVVTSDGDNVTMLLVPQADREVTASLEPAARLLAMWGRREPSSPIVIEPSADRSLLNDLYGW